MLTVGGDIPTPRTAVLLLRPGGGCGDAYDVVPGCPDNNLDVE
jgi:hypothetical protein